jgi:hypothetical protein
VQRKATIAAAQLAGLKVSRLINEPTAAALAYGLHRKDDESTFLVVDLGGGTFDVSILEMFSGVMEVRASAGDAFLGGEDFTDILVALLDKDLGRDDLGREICHGCVRWLTKQSTSFQPAKTPISDMFWTANRSIFLSLQIVLRRQRRS